jgi:hypothetical protein
MTGWQEFIFNVHSWVIIVFSWGSGYLIGTKLEDKVPTWLLKIIVVFSLYEVFHTFLKPYLSTNLNCSQNPYLSCHSIPVSVL